MQTTLVKSIATLEVPQPGSEDLKSNEHREITHHEFVNKNRDFSRITESDLDSVFRALKLRCPKSWTRELEIRARELNGKFMTLREGDASIFVDPDRKMAELKKDDGDLQRLMMVPETWSMYTTERAFEFSEILRHFTIFAPFDGRPFVRAWLQALMPCFSRWILLSDSREKRVIKTLKNFLGAFGQPGIIVCLADKGANMLEILKNSARSVEALGRGTVERHYWKRLTESCCGRDTGWRQLASIESKPLLLSQLDCVPHDWVSDANDWCHVFANVVSPEISERFEKKIVETLNENEKWVIKAGPPKTLARSLAKGREYMSESKHEKLPRKLARWTNFKNKFESVFKRVPSKPEDFVWNIADFARCSITVPTAGDVIKVKRLIERQFPVICLKNGYNNDVGVKGSGYRDLKLLVEAEFSDLHLGGVVRAQPKTKLICEIQILCEFWLVNKKTTSMSYKILRAQSLRDLFYDAAKYVERENTDLQESWMNATEIIKNGWTNLAKCADVSNIDADELLLESCCTGWSKAGVTTLVKDLKANTEVTDKAGYTPIMRACEKGFDDLVKCLIELGSNIEHRNSFNSTALHVGARYCKEGCVRILLSAKADIDARDSSGRSALDKARDYYNRSKDTSNHDHTMNYNRIVNLLEGKSVGPVRETAQIHSKFDEMKKAAIEGSLAQFLDVNDVRLSLISELLATRTVVGSLENLVQALWFGGNIEQKGEYDYTPINWAAQEGTMESIIVLLDFGADVNTPDTEGCSPLLNAIYWRKEVAEDVVKLLLRGKADVNQKNNLGSTPLNAAIKTRNHGCTKLLLEAKADVNVIGEYGITYLQYAAIFGSGVSVTQLLKFNANVDDDTFDHYALQNRTDRESVLNALAEHRREERSSKVSTLCLGNIV